MVCEHEYNYLQKPEDSIGSSVEKFIGIYELSDVGASNELLGLIQGQLHWNISIDLRKFKK